MSVVETGALGTGGTSGKLLGVDSAGLGAAAAAATGVVDAATGCGGGGAELGDEVGAEVAPAANFIIVKRAVIVLPSSTSNASMTPAFGAATSIVVLSVSILATISSVLTESPTFFY